MREWTQTNVDPGNCWQTAVACILDLDPAELPDQVAIEAAKKSYSNALNAFLERHHGLMYSEVYDYQIGALAVRDPGWHMLVGPTVRTASNGGRNHVVVARHGVMVWDPHPSRAGLIEVERWGILASLPARILQFRDERRAQGDTEMTCACPKCGSSCPPPQA